MNRSPPDTIFAQMFLLCGLDREIFNSENITQQRTPGVTNWEENQDFLCVRMWFLFSPIVSYCLLVCVRLCVLQQDLSFSALVQLFDPLLSPRCYAVVGLKSYEDGISRWWTWWYICTWLESAGYGVMIILDQISNHIWVTVFCMRSLVLVLTIWFNLNVVIYLCCLCRTFSNILFFLMTFLMKNKSSTFLAFSPRPCALLENTWKNCQARLIELYPSQPFVFEKTLVFKGRSGSRGHCGI